jgi:nucleotide sugar dehydrogenase
LDIGVDKKPDFSKMDMACLEISKYLKSGQTVIVETTVPVGTLRNRIAPLLESISGLIAGKDFHLAFSPERVSSGTMKMGFSTYPKLVGGLTFPCAENAARLYRQGFKFHSNPLIKREVGVWIMGSTEAAEFAKLAETTYRDVNLALANTFALASMKHGIDYLEVVEACNSQPFSQLHNPGIAIGGHCIPVYPHLFLESNDGLGLIESARSINDAMPSRMVALAQGVSEARAGSKALIIGLCYRTGVRESAHSGAFQLRDALSAIGLEVELVDELFHDDEIEAMGFVPRSPESIFEHVFINSGDEGFVESVVSQMPDTTLVVDGRRTLKSKSNQVRITL